MKRWIDAFTHPVLWWRELREACRDGRRLGREAVARSKAREEQR